MNNTTTSQAPEDISELLAAWQTHQDHRDRGSFGAELVSSLDHLNSARAIVRSSLALAS